MSHEILERGIKGQKVRESTILGDKLKKIYSNKMY